MSGSAKPRHFAEFMRSMYPAFSRRATQVCVLSSALEKIALDAPNAPAIAFAALEQANPFGWADRRCKVPPPGWWCSREPGHDGPCAARPTAADDKPEQEVSHVCGLQGDNGMIDPPCPACEANRARWDAESSASNAGVALVDGEPK